MSELEKTNILLPKKLKREAKIQAVEEDISLSELIRRALTAYLAERKDHATLDEEGHRPMATRA